MNANSSSQSVMKAGAVAMSALGTGEAAGRVCVDELQALCTSSDASGGDKDGISHIGDAVQVGFLFLVRVVFFRMEVSFRFPMCTSGLQRLGNLVMIDGVVTAGTASSILSTLTSEGVLFRTKRIQIFK
jgi:hypothetical protein